MTARSTLPSALRDFDRFVAATGGRRPSVFLDYDGVLTPIVAHPDLAVISPDMRRVVSHLAGLIDLAVISGRDTSDVMDKVGVAGVWYAGSHGFDIVSPDGSAADDDALHRFDAYLGPLERAAAAIEARISDIDGAHVERKRFAIAVHFRQATAEDAEHGIESVVRAVAEADDRLKVTTGKKILELRPNVEWDKGRALEWLIGRLEIDLTASIPLYLGDDVTDEDAFSVLVDGGIGIVVGRDGPATLASFALDDPGEVGAFLDRLATEVER